MSKLTNYVASVEIASGLKPKNGNDFPLLEAHSIVVDETGTRLDERLKGVSEKGARIDKRLKELEPTDEIEEGSKLPITSGAIYEVFRFLEEI